MGFTVVLRRVALISALLGGLLAGVDRVSAQSTTPTMPAPATPAPVNPPAAAPATPAPATPPAPAPDAAPSAPAPAPPSPAPAPDTGNADKNPPDTSISQTFDLQARPVIMLSGKAAWDEGFKSINDAFDKLRGNLDKTGTKATGYPTAIFTQTDDAGFTFDAMIPVEKAPDGKPDLAADVSFGLSPAGKVMKFQHRSAYDDIDSTYEAITAYLDEKGLESKNMFAEEYLNRTKTSDDPSLEVDILVFLK